MQIFFGMLLGYLLFHEVPTGNELFGSMLIFLAVVVAMSSESKIFSRIRKKQMNVAVAKATDSV
jgi:drug/metabolite transporter (DMT)-like permease